MVLPHHKAPINKSNRIHNNQMVNWNVWHGWVTGMDHLIDPHDPNCMNFGIVKLLTGGGRY